MIPAFMDAPFVERGALFQGLETAASYFAMSPRAAGATSRQVGAGTKHEITME
jgi:hypothetical protein